MAGALGLVGCALVLPESVFGPGAANLHRAALLPLSLIIHVVALSRREWRLLAAPATVFLAALASWALSSIAGRPWELDLWAAVVLLIYWAPFGIVRRRQDARMLLWVAALTPVVVLVVAALLGVLTLPTHLTGGARLEATSNANVLAWTLVVALTAAHALRQGTTRPRDFRWPVIICLYALLLAFTSSRLGGLAALLLASAAVRREVRAEQAWLGAMWPWIPALVVWVVRVTSRQASAPASDTVLGIRSSGRLEIWQTLVEHGSDALWTGGGWGHALRLAHEHVGRFITAHNEYLWLLLDVGLVGIAITGIGLFIAWRNRWRNLPPPARWVHGTLILALPVLATVEPVLQSMPFTLPLAIVMGAVPLAVSPAPTEPPPSRPG